MSYAYERNNMSFSGDLEHLPIVDVIQLIHSTQKTGTLRITNGRSECQLVFEKGYIVSANHANNNVRIGNILVKNGAITEAQLEQTLAVQSAAGDRRQPLIAALIEGGSIKKEDAFKGLESLIHLTIVQILSWHKGTFILDVESGNIGDNYRYFPEQLHEDFLLGTQGVLMDALRIFDEKMRDGELEDGVWADEDPVATETDLDLSAELLGLDELDKLERAIPQVYAGLRDHPPLDSQRERLRKLLTTATDEERECFDRFLKTFTASSKNNVHGNEDAGGIVLFSHDELLKFAVTTILKQLGFQVFATGDTTDLEFMTGQYLSRGFIPLVFFDSPVRCADGASEASVTEQRRHLQNTHPQAAIVQLASPTTPEFSLQAYRDGVLAVMPRRDQDVDIDATIAFYRTLQEFSTHFIERQEQQPFARFSRYCDQLEKLSLAPELSAALLSFVSEMFQRGLTLIVAKNELIAERGIGINTPREDGPTHAPKIKLPLAEDSIFRQAVTTGKTFYAESNDAILKEYLFSVIGTPRTERVLLLPFKSRGRVIALIYADFGENAPTATHIGLLKTLADHAGLVLDEALFRKQLEKMTH
ncbi:MAG: DUF4388 domain-containing protein [Desulfuromonadales bacterium]|nr:DUF4388 domain-containing protein [Desulfuromonadales bacterium]